MLEILERITGGEGTPEDVDKLRRLSIQIKEASLCGLGQTAPNPVLTTLQYFMDEVLTHINDKKCPAKICGTLVDYFIDPAKCTGCTLCAKVCASNAIRGKLKELHVIDNALCIKCGKCITSCTFGAVYKD
jgi:Na+-translocating ferredoxin:NAD+ oxidoreductase RNF subunit RnfB